jgi:hypothetical protein
LLDSSFSEACELAPLCQHFATKIALLSAEATFM